MNEFFTEELIETTYLYCYKRLNNSEEARDLAQDILVEALSAAKSGKEIKSFFPWYWQLAHNRYCLFLRMQAKGVVSLDATGGSIATDEDITEQLVNDQEISDLNYAVSRLSKIHRETIILYYLQQMQIKDIANRLDLPEGTVKRRLFDAKSDIKKGVEKMNHVGKSSYAPAELKLWGGYGVPNYWKEIDDLMTKQIFATCSKNPVTIKEIADEIGVAPVYFEEKLKYLLNNKFIKETSRGKYLTDFVIFSEQVWADFRFELSRIYETVGEEITQRICSVEKPIRALPFYGNDMEFSYLLWILYVYACTAVSNGMLKIYQGKWTGKIPEGNGKDYRVAGTVIYPSEKIEYKDTKQVSWSNIHYHFQTSRYHKITYANLFQAPPFSDRDQHISDLNINTVMKIFDDPIAELTDVEQEKAAHLIQRGFARRKDDSIFLTMPVMDYGIQKAIEDILAKATADLCLKYVQSVSDLGDQLLLPHIREDLMEEYVNWIMRNSFWPLNKVMYYGIHEGKTLAIPEDYAKSAAGVCLYYLK